MPRSDGQRGASHREGPTNAATAMFCSPARPMVRLVARSLVVVVVAMAVVIGTTVGATGQVIPPITAPSVTLPPITVPPVTLPPVTLPPVTLPPVTLPPVTLPP